MQQPTVQEIQLTRDCPAIRIPSGDPVILKEGTSLTVTQMLGGAATLRDESGLFRVELEEADALGEALAEALRHQAYEDHAAHGGAESAAADAHSFSEEAVWQALRGCYDPEIPVNIVDLGLIYDLKAQPEPGPDGLHSVEVKMTLTARGCGMGPTIAEDARRRIEAHPAVSRAAVEIVWDPQWTPHMIAPEARKTLGLE